MFTKSPHPSGPAFGRTDGKARAALRARTAIGRTSTRGRCPACPREKGSHSAEAAEARTPIRTGSPLHGRTRCDLESARRILKLRLRFKWRVDKEATIFYSRSRLSAGRKQASLAGDAGAIAVYVANEGFDFSLVANVIDDVAASGDRKTQV